MYNNVGKKIKIIAIVFAILGVVASIIFGCMFFSLPNGALVGFLILVLGSIASFVLSLFSYGFGQLIESIHNIERKMTEENN